MERFLTVTSNELKEHIDSITPENTIKKWIGQKKSSMIGFKYGRFALMKYPKYLNAVMKWSGRFRSLSSKFLPEKGT